MKAQIVKTVYVEAARRVSASDTGGEDYTGNRYRVDIIAEGEVDNAVGWVIDYGDMKRFFDPVRQDLDHCCLNDLPGLAEDASLEALERWILDRLRPWPSWFSGIRVSLGAPPAFTLVRLPPDAVLGLPERVSFFFSAAQSLPQLPEGHPCRELHGHTYQVEIAPAQLAGIEAGAREVFSRLDNTYLNRIPGLEQATAERIAAWIWKFLMDRHITPALVAVQETPSNRCHYYGE